MVAYFQGCRGFQFVLADGLLCSNRQSERIEHQLLAVLAVELFLDCLNNEAVHADMYGPGVLIYLLAYTAGHPHDKFVRNT